MNKVLFISQWYPHRYDPMFGLFVRKHAEAAGRLNNVKVLYIHPSSQNTRFETTIQEKNNITEITVYYPAKNISLKERILKFANYLIAYNIGFKALQELQFRPDLIHANILTRTGLIALWYSKKLKVPYVITEHWSRYLPIRNEYTGFFRKRATELIVKHSSAIFPVSSNLQEAMQNHGLKNSNYIVINNVVDDFFFQPIQQNIRNKKRILHISCFDEKAKNIKGILRAAKELCELRSDFELVFIGTGLDYPDVYEFHKSLDFPENTVTFLGELSPTEVGDQIKNCDLTIMFSNYENSPVVIAESLACGKPVLSTNVGGIPELINDTNGILINPKDEKKLTYKLDYMLNHLSDYKAELISEQAKHLFSYQAVAQKITNEYTQIITKHRL